VYSTAPYGDGWERSVAVVVFMVGVAVQRAGCALPHPREAAKKRREEARRASTGAESGSGRDERRSRRAEDGERRSEAASCTVDQGAEKHTQQPPRAGPTTRRITCASGPLSRLIERVHACPHQGDLPWLALLAQSFIQRSCCAGSQARGSRSTLGK
jgi:hypothetical protein